MLTRMNGERVLSVRDFQRMLYLIGVGRTVEIEIFRNGELLEMKVAIEQRPVTATTS